MKIETQHILVHIIYPVNIPKVRHLIISTPYYRFSEYLRCSTIPRIEQNLYTFQYLYAGMVAHYAQTVAYYVVYLLY